MIPCVELGDRSPEQRKASVPLIPQPNSGLFLSPRPRNSLRCWSGDLATQRVCRFIIDETDGVEGGLDFRIRHELLPDQARAVVLDHDHDGSLVEAHVDVLEPVFGLVEAIAETVDAPEFVTKIAVEVF